MASPRLMEALNLKGELNRGAVLSGVKGEDGGTEEAARQGSEVRWQGKEYGPIRQSRKRQSSDSGSRILLRW